MAEGYEGKCEKCGSTKLKWFDDYSCYSYTCLECGHEEEFSDIPL